MQREAWERYIVRVRSPLALLLVHNPLGPTSTQLLQVTLDSSFEPKPPSPNPEPSLAEAAGA